MKTDNNYFTFLGTMYQGNFEQAFQIYQNNQVYNTFSEWLKDNLPAINSHKIHLETTEKEFLTARLKENKYNVSKTASLIGITRIGLNNKIASLKIEMPNNRKIKYLQYTKKK